jgi:hypothetical protein
MDHESVECDRWRIALRACRAAAPSAQQLAVQPIEDQLGLIILAGVGVAAAATLLAIIGMSNGQP